MSADIYEEGEDRRGGRDRRAEGAPRRLRAQAEQHEADQHIDGQAGHQDCSMQCGSVAEHQDKGQGSKKQSAGRLKELSRNSASSDAPI